MWFWGWLFVMVLRVVLRQLKGLMLFIFVVLMSDVMWFYVLLFLLCLVNNVFFLFRVIGWMRFLMLLELILMCLLWRKVCRLFQWWWMQVSFLFKWDLVEMCRCCCCSQFLNVVMRGVVCVCWVESCCLGKQLWMLVLMVQILVMWCRFLVVILDLLWLNIFFSLCCVWVQ